MYNPNQDHANDLKVHERLNLLKDSLSKTLTSFYPLAGTIKDDLSIDCNDVEITLQTCYGSEEVVYPNLSAPCLFPVNDLSLKDSSMVMWGSLLKLGKCRTARFVFDSSKLAALKADVVANGIKDPTRVEVVSALLWKCFMNATEEKTGSWKPSLLSHVVTLRKWLHE
ncbi:HXXXD-type acyl-transferase family protein [Artemisia annua]|uniref:HXXXD-type acyl-transferase family protein n=1 Tax=Artemisia annua TaxID=35608 RepID=A0A2U1PM81_ARTAN|nr:HXXXD-type acyl-transferase family protein [Artemisia annua]